MDENIEYVSGHYQQFIEEPRMQELDIMQEKEVLVELQPIIVRKRSRKGRRKGSRRGSKKGGKKSNRKYKH